MADFNYTGGVRFAPDIVVDVTADKDGNPTKACNPITGVCIEGGGGDSDFSTAKVTINSCNLAVGVTIPICVTYEPAIAGAVPIPVGSAMSFPLTLDIILYKGLSIIPAQEANISNQTGDISYDSDLQLWKVTGDCSFDLSALV